MSRASSFTLRPEIISGAVCLLLVGCSFSPNFPEGTIACDSAKPSSCPPGYSCVEGYCRSRVGDGGIDRSEGGLSEDAVKDQAADQTQPGDGGDSPVGDASDADASDGRTDVPAIPDASEDVRVDAGADSSTDTGADAPNDAGPDTPSCTVTCSAGDTRCGTGGGLQTCSIVAGCPTWGPEVACPGSKTCQGTAPKASCSCPAPPAACAQGAGASCASSSSLTTCEANGDGCLTASTKACLSGDYCWGSFPSAACNSPLTLGWPDDLQSSGNRTAGYLMGYPIDVWAPVTLRGFGIIARSTAAAQIGLYRQNGSGDLELVTFVAVSVTGTRNEFAAPEVQLDAGVTYWMMVTYETQISVGQNLDPTATLRMRMTFTYGNPLPATITGTTLTKEPGTLTNYYLLVTPK